MSQQWVFGAQPIVRIFIVEPSSIVVDALKLIFALDKYLEVVASSPDVDAVQISFYRPDVIMLDLDGLTVSIEEAINTCESAAPLSRVCILSIVQRVSVMQRVLAARAAGYVVKDTHPSVLVQIVHSIARGEFYADPRLAGTLLRKRATRSGKSSILSDREIEVVRLIADGLSNREIGMRISVSEKTVKNQVSQILSKLKISARAGVAVYAVRNGIVR